MAFIFLRNWSRENIVLVFLAWDMLKTLFLMTAQLYGKTIMYDIEE